MGEIFDSITYTIGSRNYTANFQHNQAGLHTRFGHLYYEYDSRGRLLAVKNALGAAWLSNVTYNVAGQVTGDTLGNGLGAITETFGYDANRLQNTTHTATRGMNSFMNLTYSYTASAGQQGTGSTAGNNGLLMNVTGTLNGQIENAAYTYDLLGRLATANQTTYDKAIVTAQRRFQYDRFGNRTGVWDATLGGTQIQNIALEQPNSVPTNRITSVTQGTTLTYSYDRNGNVTSDGVHTYQYDAENRVVSVDNGITAQYSYNHRNQRVKKVTGGATVHYVCHKEGVLAEYNGATGALLVQYVSLGHQQFAKVDNGTTYYYLSDRLSARVVLDASGNVLGRQTTLPYSKTIVYPNS